MSSELSQGIRNQSAFDLLVAGEFDSAAQSLEAQLSDGVDFAATVQAYAYVLMCSDQFDRLLATIAQWRSKLLTDAATASVCAGVLSVLDRPEDAKEFATEFKKLGGSDDTLLNVSAEAARCVGEPELQMDFLFERTSLPELDRDRALLQYLQVCLQYMAVDRVRAVRDLADPNSRHGQFVLAIIEAVEGDSGAVLERVNRWLSDPNPDPKHFNAIMGLWAEAGIPDLFKVAQRAAQMFQDDPDVTARALLHHLLGFKGLNRGELPEVQRLTISPSNHVEMVEALIDQGDLDTAAEILAQTATVARPSDQDRRDILNKLIARLKSLHIRREIVVDRPEEDWILSEPADPRKLCVVFTGLNGRPTIGGIQTLDRFLASFGYQVLYVRDFNRLAYANGILSRGAGQADALAAIANLIQSTRAKDTVFFGSSLGAVGAVEYGLKLNATRIVSFGYHSRKKSNDRWRWGDARAPLLCCREYQYARGEIRSLQDHLEAADYDYEIDMYYARRNLVDSYYARAHVHMAGLRFHPMENIRSHDSLRNMMCDGSLKNLF